MRQWGPRFFAGVLVLLALVAAGLLVAWPSLTYAIFVPIGVAIALLLSGRLRTVTLVIGGVIAVTALVVFPGDIDAHGLSALAVLVVTVGLALITQRAADRLGVSQQTAVAMLEELRNRHAVQTRLPELPLGWNVDSCVQPAGGDPLAGDIVVGSMQTPGRFDLAVLDVSGKGMTSASRAMLLGGAMNGLLGVLPAERVLPASNSYLLRQQWLDGFASAMHVSIDLTSGEFSVGSAGHPVGVQYHAGSGRWEQLTGSTGVALGVIEGLTAGDYPRRCGRLEPGDAILLYSDGVIETPNTDLTQGIDRMLGAADRAIADGRVGSAARICATARSGQSDDRTVVLLWRD